MEGEESVLDAIYEEDEGFDTMEDVDMVDVEEGEIFAEHDLPSGERQNGEDKDKEGILGNKDGQNQPNKNKRKKNKKKKRRNGPVMGKPMDLDRYLSLYPFCSSVTLA